MKTTSKYIPSIFTEPFTCRFHCPRKNEPLPSSTDPRYVELNDEIRIALPGIFYGHLLYNLLHLPNPALYQSIISRIQQIFVVTGQFPTYEDEDLICTELQQPPPIFSINDVTSHKQLLDALKDSFHMIFLHFKIKQNRAVEVEVEGDCIHMLFDDNLNKFLETDYYGSDIYTSQRDNTFIVRTGIADALKSWFQDLIADGTIPSDWCEISVFHQEIDELVADILSKITEPIGNWLRDSSESPINRFRQLLSREEPLKLYDTISRVFKVSPLVGSSIRLLKSKQKLSEVLDMLLSPSQFERYERFKDQAQELSELQSIDEKVKTEAVRNELETIELSGKVGTTSNTFSRVVGTDQSLESSPSKFAARRARKKAQKLQARLASQDSQPFAASILYLSSIDQDFKGTTDSETKDIVSNSLVLVDISSLKLDPGSDYDNIPGLDDASDTDSD